VLKKNLSLPHAFLNFRLLAFKRADVAIYSLRACNAALVDAGAARIRERYSIHSWTTALERMRLGWTAVIL
jgi:hypothetical protein